MSKADDYYRNENLSVKVHLLHFEVEIKVLENERLEARQKLRVRLLIKDLVIRALRANQDKLNELISTLGKENLQVLALKPTIFEYKQHLKILEIQETESINRLRSLRTRLMLLRNLVEELRSDIS